MIFILKCAYNLTLSALTYKNAALHFQKKVKEKEDEEEHNEKGNSWGALTTKGAGIMALPASVTLLPCSQFTSEHRTKAQNSKEKTSVYRLASFLKHCYSTLPVSVCPTTCVLCVLLHVSSHHGNVCCHFPSGVILHRSQTKHQAMAWDACGLQLVPLPLFPLAYCFSCTFSAFALISFILSFLGVLALPSPCSSLRFCPLQTGLICREKWLDFEYRKEKAWSPTC